MDRTKDNMSSSLIPPSWTARVHDHWSDFPHNWFQGVSGQWSYTRRWPLPSIWLELYKDDMLPWVLSILFIVMWHTTWRTDRSLEYIRILKNLSHCRVCSNCSTYSIWKVNKMINILPKGKANSMKLSWDHASVWLLDCFKVYGRADYFMFHGFLYVFFTVRKMSLPCRFTQKTRQYFLYWTVDDLSRWSKSRRGKLSINLFSQRWNLFWKRKQNSSVSYCEG